MDATLLLYGVYAGLVLAAGLAVCGVSELMRGRRAAFESRLRRMSDSALNSTEGREESGPGPAGRRFRQTTARLARQLRRAGPGRAKAIEARLPEALDIMVRALRAGHPISSAMAMVRTDLTGPIADEFGRAVDEMTFGLSLREALGNMVRRAQVPQIRFVAATIALQSETGGSLAEILQSLADLMRARQRMRRKIRVHSAEARMSAKFLAIMPLVFVGLVFFANADVYRSAAQDPIFWPVLLGAGALQVLGIVLIHRLARFKA